MPFWGIASKIRRTESGKALQLAAQIIEHNKFFPYLLKSRAFLQTVPMRWTEQTLPHVNLWSEAVCPRQPTQQHCGTTKLKIQVQK